MDFKTVAGWVAVSGVLVLGMNVAFEGLSRSAVPASSVSQRVREAFQAGRIPDCSQIKVRVGEGTDIWTAVHVDKTRSGAVDFIDGQKRHHELGYRNDANWSPVVGLFRNGPVKSNRHKNCSPA